MECSDIVLKVRIMYPDLRGDPYRQKQVYYVVGSQNWWQYVIPQYGLQIEFDDKHRVLHLRPVDEDGEDSDSVISVPYEVLPELVRVLAQTSLLTAAYLFSQEKTGDPGRATGNA